MIPLLFYILYLILIFFDQIFTCYVFSINCDNIYYHYSIISSIIKLPNRKFIFVIVFSIIKLNSGLATLASWHPSQHLKTNGKYSFFGTKSFFLIFQLAGPETNGLIHFSFSPPLERSTARRTCPKYNKNIATMVPQSRQLPAALIFVIASWGVNLSHVGTIV